MLQSRIASSNHTNVCSPVYVWAGRGFVCIWTLTKDIPSSSLLFLDCDGGISRVDGPHTSLTHTSLAAVIRLCTLSVFLPSFHSVCPFPSLFLSWHLSALGISITWPPCFRAFFCIIVSLYYPSLSLPSPPFHSKLTPPHSEFLNLYSCLFPYIFVPPPLFQSPIHAVHETLPWMASLEMFCLRSFIPFHLYMQQPFQLFL